MLDLITLQNLPNTQLGKLANSIRYLRGYSPQPFFISFIITYRCNLNCEFCYQKTYPKTKKLYFNIKDLPLIHKNINYFFKPRIHIFGGEPMMHPHFLDIVRFFAENKYKLSMTTNGTKLNEYVDTLKQFKEVNISLNSDNWKGVVEIADKLKKKTKIRINLVYVLSSTDKINKIIKVFKSTKIDSLILQHLMFDNVNKTKNKLKLMTYMKNSLIRYYPAIKKNDIKNYYSNLIFPSQKKCLRPWFTFFLLPDCNVIPCEQPKSIILGNLKEQKLSEIWNGKKFRDFRSKIQKDGIWSSCFRCCHRQYY